MGGKKGCCRYVCGADGRLVFSKDTSEFEGMSGLPYTMLAIKRHRDIVESLLASVAGGPKQSTLVNIANKMGFTPLFYAAQRQHLDLVQFLLDSGADPAIFGCQDPEENPKINFIALRIWHVITRLSN